MAAYGAHAPRHEGDVRRVIVMWCRVEDSAQTPDRSIPRKPGSPRVRDDKISEGGSQDPGREGRPGPASDAAAGVEAAGWLGRRRGDTVLYAGGHTTLICGRR